MPRGVYKRTENTRNKMSESKKRYFTNGGLSSRGMLGKKQSEKQKKKMSEVHKGKKLSKITIEKIKKNHIRMTGKRHSD